MASGFAGAAIALCHVGRALEDSQLQRAALQYLDYSVASLPLARQPLAGLLNGIAGICFAARLVAPGKPSTIRLLGYLEKLLSEETRRLAAVVSATDGLAFNAFDAVSGLSGIGRYWLTASDSEFAQCSITISVQALTEMLRESSLPRWRTPSALNDDASQAKNYPAGTLNCGLAHGIPGPIAFLSLALDAGCAPASTGPVLRKTVDWLIAASVEDEYGPNWPTFIPVVATSNCPDGARAAWCYGGPGLSRALMLAGRALTDPDIVRVSLDAIKSAHKRPLAKRRIDSPILCHGKGGLLLITLRHIHDVADSELIAGADHICREIIDAADEKRSLIYQDIEPSGAMVDRPGLLEGALGVALALIGVSERDEPLWDKVLLIS